MGIKNLRGNLISWLKEPLRQLELVYLALYVFLKTHLYIIFDDKVRDLELNHANLTVQ